MRILLFCSFAYNFFIHPLPEQGFPILMKRTATGEQEIKSLLEGGVEVAHLSCDIANPCTIIKLNIALLS